MAAATARVGVSMTPDEKAALDAKAERSGRISAAELVRRAETLVHLDHTDRKRDETLAAPGHGGE